MRPYIKSKYQKSLYIIYSVTIVTILSLVFINNTYADESLNLDYTITVEPSLNVTTSAQDISLNLNPANHPFDTKDLTVSVGTNNETGYKLILSTIDNTTNLVEQNDHSLYIETLINESDESNFPGNRWGYKLDSTNTNYIPFTSNILISSSDKPTPTIITNTLSFAAKANYDTKAGTYNLALNFQATANPLFKTIADAEYLQEVSPKEQGGCPADLSTETVYTLKDARDNKEYKVARLKDGNCWMVSDLNLAGGTRLYSGTSNVPDGYPESGNNPYYTLPASSLSGFLDNSVAYVYNTGLETTKQSDCTSAQPCNSYYSWLAAVAGNKENITSDGADASYSICPSGWRLPKSGKDNDTSATSTVGYKKGDFYRLATAYGANLESNQSQNTNVFYKNAGPGTTANFLLSGYYHDNSFGVGGSVGFCWSSSSISSSSAYGLYLNSGSVYSANTNRRLVGFPVRCLLAE